MPRSIWNGTIRFGMVAIPAKLYLASESKDGTAMNVLCAEHKVRIQQKRTCPEGDHVVEAADQVKGYERSKGEYVIVTEDDLASLPLPSKDAIEITGFAPADSVPAALFLETPYFLEPEKGGDKPYALLRDALRSTGRIGLAKFALRSRERLVTIRVIDDCLVLNTLRWPEEIRSADELKIPTAASDPKMRAQAVMLIEAMATDFEPADYADEYRAAFTAMIDAKAGGQTVSAPTAKPAATASDDLFDLLAASVAARKAA